MPDKVISMSHSAKCRQHNNSQLIKSVSLVITVHIPGSSSIWNDFLSEFLTYQSNILPTNGDMRVALASAQATAWKYIRMNLRPVHTRDPINPRSLPLWKNGQIGKERALIGESVCWSKIQRGLVGPALRGRGERDKFFNRLKNGRGWSRSPQVVCWAGVQRGGQRYSVGWSYFDRA